VPGISRVIYLFWLSFHKALNSVVGMVTVPIAAAMTTLGGQAKSEIVQKHSTVGITLAIICIIQVSVGKTLKYYLSKENPISLRRFRTLHKLIGYISLYVSWLNCSIGVSLFKPDLYDLLLNVYYMLLVGGIILEIWWRFPNFVLFKFLQLGVVIKQNKQKHLLPKYTVEEIVAQSSIGAEIVAQSSIGAAWVIMGDDVYDVEDIIDKHPGGSYLIKSTLGQDIGKFFDGGNSLSPNTLPHTHSLHARKLLERHICGMIKPIEGLKFPRQHKAALLNEIGKLNILPELNRWVLESINKETGTIYKLQLKSDDFYLSLKPRGIEWFGKCVIVTLNIKGYSVSRYYSYCPSLIRYQHDSSSTFSNEDAENNLLKSGRSVSQSVVGAAIPIKGQSIVGHKSTVVGVSLAGIRKGMKKFQEEDSDEEDTKMLANSGMAHKDVS